VKKLLAVMLVALAVPATAAGKEITGLELCGPSACAAADRSFGHEGLSLDAPVAPPPAAEYYRVQLEIDGASQFGFYYVPARGLVTSETEAGWTQWMRPAPAFARTLRRLAQRVEPFPAPKVRSVLVDGRRITAAASSYLDLYEVRGKPGYPGDYPIVRLSLHGDVPSPWTDTKLVYFPQNDVLQVAPGRFVRVPAAVAAKLEASRAATRASAEGSRDRRAPAIGFALMLGALVAGAAVIGRRRRPRG
jgi:hypothetical protein